MFCSDKKQNSARVATVSATEKAEMHSTVGQKLGHEDLGVSSFNNRMRVHDVYSLPFSITSSQAATRGLKW